MTFNDMFGMLYKLCIICMAIGEVYKDIYSTYGMCHITHNLSLYFVLIGNFLLDSLIL